MKKTNATNPIPTLPQEEGQPGQAPPGRRRRLTSNAAILVGAAILLATGITQIVNYFDIQAAEAAFAEQMRAYELSASAAPTEPATPSVPAATSTPSPTLAPGVTATPTPTPGPTSPPKATPTPGLKYLGTLKIARMNLTVPVLQGTSATELRYGVGHVISTAMPGQKGNATLAGHRRGAASHPFSNLDRLKPGDKVEYTDGAHAYVYVVYDSFIVDADAKWVMRPIEGVDYGMTLISCSYPLFGPTQRLIVRARLEGT